jgi:hypothetical protein
MGLNARRTIKELQELTRTAMTKRLVAAVLVLAAGGAAPAGEQDIVLRLKKAGTEVHRVDWDGEKDGLCVRCTDARDPHAALAELTLPP